MGQASAKALLLGLALFGRIPGAHAEDVSEEFTIGVPRAEPLLTPSRSHAFWDGKQFVVLSMQPRVPDYFPFRELREVWYVARITRDGEVLDPAGVPLVLPELGTGLSNFAVRDGEWLMLSADNRVGQVGYTDPGVSLIRVMANDLGSAKKYGLLTEPESAWLDCFDGDCLLVLPPQSEMPELLQSRLISGSMAPGSARALPLSHIDGITHDDDGYLVYWLELLEETNSVGEPRMQGHGLFIARIAADGEPSGPPIEVFRYHSVGQSAPFHPLVVHGDGNYLYRWQDWPTSSQGGGMPAFALRMNAKGEALDSVPIALGGNRGDDQIVWDGARFVIASTEYDSSNSEQVVRLQGLAPDGELRALGALDGMELRSMVSDGAGTTLVVDDRVRGTWLDADAQPLGEPRAITRAAPQQFAAAVVHGAGGDLVVYHELSSAGVTARYVRLDEGGKPLDPDSRELVKLADPEAGTSKIVQVAFDGNSFVIAAPAPIGAADPLSHRLFYLDPTTGDVVREIVVPGSHGGDSSLLIGGDGGVLSLWRESRNCGEDCGESRWLALPLDGRGEPLLAQPIEVRGWQGGSCFQPHAAFDGDAYLMFCGWDGLDATRILPQGWVVTTTRIPVVVDQDSSFPTVSELHGVSWSGREFLAVWDVTPDLGIDGQSEVRAARIGRDLVAIDEVAFEVSARPGLARGSSVAFDGTDFVVGWQGREEGDSDWDAFATRVTRGGEVLQPHGYAISQRETDELGLSIAAQDGRLVAAYHRLDVSPEVGAARLGWRIIEPGPSELGVGCGADGQCASGFCVDFVCCESACADPDPQGGVLACAAHIRGGGADGRCEVWREPVDEGTPGGDDAGALDGAEAGGGCGCTLLGRPSRPRGIMPAALTVSLLWMARARRRTRAKRGT